MSSEIIPLAPVFYEVDGVMIQIPAAVYAAGFAAVETYLAEQTAPALPEPEPEILDEENEEPLDI